MSRVVGFELNSQAPEKAIHFYSEVFGWEFEEPNWGYWPIKTNPVDQVVVISGGIAEGPADYPHGIRIQIEVSSVDEVITKAKKLGAKVVREKMEFDDFYLAYLVDPVGLGLGIIERKKI